MTETEMLAEAVRRIRAQFAPVHIILFGSRARGESRADSDYDLLVVTAGPCDWRLAGQIQAAMAGLRASFDIIAESLDDWQRRRVQVVAFEHAIWREGKVLLDAGG